MYVLIVSTFLTVGPESTRAPTSAYFGFLGTFLCKVCKTTQNSPSKPSATPQCGAGEPCRRRVRIGPSPSPQTVSHRRCKCRRPTRPHSHRGHPLSHVLTSSRFDGLPRIDMAACTCQSTRLHLSLNLETPVIRSDRHRYPQLPPQCLFYELSYRLGELSAAYTLPCTYYGMHKRDTILPG